jgi:hypothetical protein
MSNLYQDAILDAKALRASAMANAKAALEEAFEPKIQQMISKKLVEEAGEEEEIEEDLALETEAKTIEEAPVEETADINEVELDEILNQLEELESHNEATLKEAEEGEVEEAKKEEEEKEEEEAEEESEDSVEAADDETKVIDITLGDLKQVLQSVMAGQAELGAEMPAEEPTADSEAEAEIDLDEILDELEATGAHGADPAEYGVSDKGHAIQTPSAGAEIEESVLNEMDPATTMGLAAAGTAGVIGLSALIAKIQDYYKKNPKATGAAVMNALGKVGSGAAAGARKAPPTTGGPN